ncbi:MAG: phosphoribosylformylglycinamidine synthase II, partial [Deltaproteobacteria bacterium]|nr:phosphoribosylformylglycinamidine synthase II [Deltaproteobacteria bacterium]
YELLLSESQERMLIVARKGSEGEVGKIFEKWDLDAVVIGEVVEGDRMEMFFNGEKVVDLPVKFLTDEAPIYDRKYAPPANLEERRGETQRLGIHAEDSCRGETQREAQVLPSDVPVSSPFNDILLKILSSPNIASKSYVFKQYDHMVQARSVCLPERGDAAVLRVMEAGEKGIAITVEGNGRLCYLDPYAGSAAAVAEGVRNLACTGARAIGITDCLNFGNPERPDVMWEFVESVRGIADACKAFRIPVISGNVSLYNETEGVSIYPTPTIGIVGILDDVNKTCGSAFRKDGDIIALLGLEEVSIAGSEYQRFFHEACRGKIPQVSLEFEKRLSDFLVASIREGLLESAHDVSEGGLAVTLAECSLYGGGKIGFSVEIARPAENAVENLFGEGPSRVVISFEKKKSASLLSLAEKYDIPLKTIGQTGGDMITIKPFADVQLIKAFDAWANGFTETLKGKS